MAIMENTSSKHWTEEEHEMFLVGLEKMGKDWKGISNFMKTKNVQQIRNHAAQFLLKAKANPSLKGAYIITTATKPKKSLAY